MYVYVRILRYSRRLFILLASLKARLFSEKMLISTRCIRGFMSNLIKKSWTDSNIEPFANAFHRVYLAAKPKRKSISNLCKDLNKVCCCGYFQCKYLSLKNLEIFVVISLYVNENIMQCELTHLLCCCKLKHQGRQASRQANEWTHFVPSLKDFRMCIMQLNPVEYQKYT